MYENSAKNRWFPTLIDFKIAKNAFFNIKLLIKIYLNDVLWGIEEVLKFILVKAMWSYTVQSVGSHIRPLPLGLGLNNTGSLDLPY
jgi:hypothetical protein